MISLETFRIHALSLPGTGESLHFKRIMFGIGKANFASFDPRSGELALRLPHTDPARQSAIERALLVTVPGKYGTEGWATVDLDRIDPTEFVDLLGIAHSSVAAEIAPKPRRAGAASRRPASPNRLD